MQFIIKRDELLKSLNFVQGVVEKKNTLPILSNVLLQLKEKKLTIIATDLDVIFYDEINDVKIINETDITIYIKNQILVLKRTKYKKYNLVYPKYSYNITNKFFIYEKDNYFGFGKIIREIFD